METVFSVYFPSLQIMGGSSYFTWTGHVPSPFYPVSLWCHINILPLQNSWNLFSSLGLGCKQCRLYINTHCNEHRRSSLRAMQMGYEIPKTPPNPLETVGVGHLSGFSTTTRWFNPPTHFQTGYLVQSINTLLCFVSGSLSTRLCHIWNCRSSPANYFLHS